MKHGTTAWKVIMTIRSLSLAVGIFFLVIGFMHMRQYPDFWSNPASIPVFVCSGITIVLKLFTPVREEVRDAE